MAAAQWCLMLAAAIWGRTCPKEQFEPECYTARCTIGITLGMAGAYEFLSRKAFRFTQGSALTRPWKLAAM